MSRGRLSIGIKEAFEVGVLEGNRQMLVELNSLTLDPDCSLNLITAYIRARLSGLETAKALGRMLGYVEPHESIRYSVDYSEEDE